VLLDQLEPLLAAEGIRLLSPSELTPSRSDSSTWYFTGRSWPIVTPLAIDPGHPFPHLGNRSLCLIASLTPSTPSPLPQAALSVVHIPDLGGAALRPAAAPPGSSPSSCSST
jgi:polyphosphate kinase